MEKLQTAIAFVVTTLTRSREQQLSLAAFAQTPTQIAGAAPDSNTATNQQLMETVETQAAGTSREVKPKPNSVQLVAQVGVGQNLKPQQSVTDSKSGASASLAFVRRPVTHALLGDCERLDAYDTLVELCALADALFSPGATCSRAHAQSGTGAASEVEAERSLVQLEQLIGTLLGFLERLLRDTRWTAELLSEHVLYSAFSLFLSLHQYLYPYSVCSRVKTSVARSRVPNLSFMVCSTCSR